MGHGWGLRDLTPGMLPGGQRAPKDLRLLAPRRDFLNHPWTF